MVPNHFLRFCVYATVCLANSCLWLGEENVPPYPLLIIAAAIVAHVFTDHWNRLILHRFLTPVVGLAIALALGAECVFIILRSTAQDFILPLGHLLAYLQVTMFFLRKKIGYYWGMLLMSFLQVLIAALHSNSPGFGFLFTIYTILLLWTISRLVLLREANQWRESQRGESEPAESEAVLPTSWRELPTSAAVSMVAMIIGLLLFLSMPRSNRAAWSGGYFGEDNAITGFDQTIELGQLGTILESNDEVMTVRLRDESGQTFKPDRELLWRGVTLARYNKGKWEKQPDLYFTRSPWPQHPGAKVFHQEIKLQPFQQDVLFGVRPMIAGQTADGTNLDLSQLDATLLRPTSVGSGPIHYTVTSAQDPNTPQGGESPTRGRRLARNLTQMSEQLREQLSDYLQDNNILDITQLQRMTSEQVAEALLRHLSNPRNFSYTLVEEPINPDLDPVLDFLKNRKAGHCEYFASGLALLLRTVGVPARVVNGFKGGDWNPVGEFYVVRQRHAHSWVEAIVGPFENPYWLSLDPTPVSAELQIVNQMTTTEAFLQKIEDVSQYLWSTYVLNYNSSEQRSGFYTPIQDTVIGQLSSLASQTKSAWKSENGPVRVLAYGAGGLVGAIVLLFLLKRLLAVVTTDQADRQKEQKPTAGFLGELARVALASVGIKPAGSGRVPFYEQLVQLLETHGISRLPTQTPRQLASNANLRLQSYNGQVADIPVEIVQQYYRVRFGGVTLSREESDQIRVQLKRLRGVKKSSKAEATLES